MKHTHPIYLLTQLPHFIWLLLLPLARRLTEWGGRIHMGNLPVLFALLLIFTAAFLRWQTKRWAVRGNALLLRSGIFFQRQYRIPFPTIAAIRESRGPMLALFGARRLHIETAAGKTAAGMTLLLSRREAEDCLAAYGEEALSPVARMRGRDTLMAALSTSNFAFGLLAAAPVLRGFGKLFGTLVQERFREVLTSAQQLAAAYVPPLLTAIALLGWALHVLKLLELYHRFSLSQNHTVLATQCGLIVKRRVFMRMAGLSAFAARQTPLLAFLRRAQLGVLYAGRTGGRGEDTFLMPLYPARQIRTLVWALQGPEKGVILQCPPRERYRAYFPAFSLFCALAGAAAIAVFFTQIPQRTIFLACAAAFPLLLLFFLPARRKSLREGTSADFNVMRTVKGFSEWTLFLRPDALQGIRLFQTPGQAESGVCTLRPMIRTTRLERFSLHNLSLWEAVSSYKNKLNEHHIERRSGPDA